MRNQEETTATRQRDVRFRRLLSQKDQGALAEFFDLYFDRIYGYVRRQVPNEHTAEDLTQDILLNVHRSLPSYDPARELEPWVFTIATNKIRDFWRTRRNQDMHSTTPVDDDAPNLEELVLSSEAPDGDVLRTELQSEVRSAVEKLSDKNQLTVQMRLYDGLSFETIARALGRTEVAVRKRYSRALQSLREPLEALWSMQTDLRKAS